MTTHTEELTTSTCEQQFNDIQARREAATERVKSLRRTAINRLAELKAGLPGALTQWGLGTIDDAKLNKEILDIVIVSQLAAINDSVLETAANHIGNICNRDIRDLKKRFEEAEITADQSNQ